MNENSSICLGKSKYNPQLSDSMFNAIFAFPCSVRRMNSTEVDDQISHFTFC